MIAIISNKNMLFRTILCLYIPEASSTNIPDYQKLRYQTDQLYFKSQEEMVELFKDYPEAIESTLEITNKCNLEIELKKNYMPAFPIPPEAGISDPDEYFERLVRERIPKRYETITNEIEERVVHEINVIKKMGYAGYFLIVQDFINAAREMSVRVGPGRGSAAGSIVSYALGITDVDPLNVSYVEQFLNKNTSSSKGKVVLATVYGDVHDIGKNLVGTILANNGFTVYDLGKQVPISTIIAKAQEVKADAIGLSALLVVTSKQMPICVQELEKWACPIPWWWGALPSTAATVTMSFVDGENFYEPGSLRQGRIRRVGYPRPVGPGQPRNLPQPH